MDIRRATVDDLPWLRMLYGELVAVHPMSYPRFAGADDLDAFTLSVYRNLAAPESGIFVAADAGQVVGFLAGEISTRPLGLPRRFGLAHYLYVLPAYRQQGVARALIATALVWLTENQIETVENYAVAGDDSWSRRGFHPMMVRYHVAVAELAAYGAAQVRAPDAPDAGPVPTPLPPTRRRRRAKRARMNGHAEAGA